MATKTSLPGLTGGVPTKTSSDSSKKPAPSSKNDAAIKKASAELASTQAQLNGLLLQLGQSVAKSGTIGGRTDASYMADKYSGTSATGQQYIEGRPVSSSEFNAWLGLGGTKGSSVASAAQAERQSAYDLMLSEFTKYGLSSLVEPLKGFVISGASPAELTLRLQETDAYKKRFAANADRIAKGLTALSPAEYVAMEDSYQNIMRNYGLPDSYYAKDSMGTQAGFRQLLANDVSATELEDRVMTAQNRVVNANPEVTKALKAFYPDITNGDILAYALDPSKALDAIKRKVTSAEIGGAALAQGLTTDAVGAEYLAKYGITKAQAQQGYGQIAGMLPRAQQLSAIYEQDPYTQAIAEADVFGTAGSAEATAKKKKLTALETAQFSGQSGTSSGALSRDRAMSQAQYISPGAGRF